MPSLLNNEDEDIRLISLAEPYFETLDDKFKKIEKQPLPIGKLSMPIYQALIDEIDGKEDRITVWKVCWKLAQSPILTIKVVYYILDLLFILRKGFKMNPDKITTILGVVGSMIVAIAGIFIPQYVDQLNETLKVIIPVISTVLATILTLMGIWTNKQPKEK